LALTGKSSDAAQTITAGLAEFRATGSTFWTPLFSSYLAKAYAELRQLADAWRSIDEVITAVQATKETLCEAEVHRVAGEIAMLSPEQDMAKRISSAHWPSRISSKQSPGNSALLRALRGSGATRARCSKRANCLLLFTGGSLRGLIRAI
jgi:hypothetical protein